MGEIGADAMETQSLKRRRGQDRIDQLPLDRWAKQHTIHAGVAAVLICHFDVG